ncbi:GTPase family protein, partial [Actinophytocola sp.]|uniref:GTPase family protein n=1 Tax=Actinophytocola sp. TaxID=1872138 RepID=UPI00389A187A
ESSPGVRGRMFDSRSQLKKIIGMLRANNPEVTEENWAKTEELLNQKIKDVLPPTIALIGLAGVGKSSTINALFNSGAPVSHYRPCTQFATPLEGDLFEYTGQGGSVVVYDMPGLGESLTADERHYATYCQVLPLVDVAIWVIEAPSRTISPIQVALHRLRKDGGGKLINKIVFAANKIDRVHPGEAAWIKQANIPSKDQDETIQLYSKFLADALRAEVPAAQKNIVCYSATRRYNLERLMEQVGAHAPDDRAWLFGRVAAIADFKELVDPKMLEWISKNAHRNPSGK